MLIGVEIRAGGILLDSSVWFASSMLLIGTKRTSSDVWCLVADGRKADVTGIAISAAIGSEHTEEFSRPQPDRRAVPRPSFALWYR